MNVVSLVSFQCLVVVITQFIVVHCQQYGAMLTQIILKDTYMQF
jgi:hypothetical protein